MVKRNPAEMELPSKAQLLFLINGMEDVRDKALVALMYLTGARISEVVGRKEKGEEPLRKYQIEFKEMFGKPFMIISHVNTLKRRKTIKRNIPINIEKEEGFVKVLKEHLNVLKDDDYLFPINRKHAWRIINKELGYFPHFMRHIRNTILTTDYNFTEQELRQVHGWSDTRPASIYTHLRYQDIAKKMI